MAQPLSGDGVDRGRLRLGWSERRQQCFEIGGAQVRDEFDGALAGSLRFAFISRAIRQQRTQGVEPKDPGLARASTGFGM